MTNELIFSFHVFLILSITVLSLYFGKEALVAWISLQSILANLFVLKQMTIFSLSSTCSDVFALGSFLGLSLLQEYFGMSVAKKTLFISFTSMLAFALLAQVHLLYHPSPPSTVQEAYALILSPSFRLFSASLLSFFIVQFIDIHFYRWLSCKMKTTHLPLRIFLALTLSQGLDTILFTVIGLIGIMDHLLSIMLVSFMLKMVIVLSSTPFTLFLRRFIPRPQGDAV